MMTDAQQREAARQFFYKWNGKGREDEDARSYWIDVLQGILGIDKVTDRVDFEKKVLDMSWVRSVCGQLKSERMMLLSCGLMVCPSKKRMRLHA